MCGWGTGAPHHMPRSDAARDLEIWGELYERNECKIADAIGELTAKSPTQLAILH